MKKESRKKKKSIPDKAVPEHRLKATIKIMVFIFVVLVGRIGWIQFVQGAELKELASRQQTLNKKITPKRGAIYDTNGKALAISAEVDTITINPAQFIVSNDDPELAKVKTEILQKKVAEGLSEIFGLNYEEVLAKVQSKKSTETIATKVEQELVDKLNNWKKENEIKSGINADPDTKRYYPYGSLAAYVIGFTGRDSQGLFGVENKWDAELKGTERKNFNNCRCNERRNFR